MLNFTRFRNANEEEISALKTRGLKSTLGNPLSFDTKSLYEDILITDDHAFAFFPASFFVDDLEQKKAEREYLRAEFDITSPYDFIPEEYLLLAGDAVIRVFAQVHGFQEGRCVNIKCIAMPELLLPEQDSVKEIIRSALFIMYAPDILSAEKYGIRLEYSDNRAEIRIVGAVY